MHLVVQKATGSKENLVGRPPLFDKASVVADAVDTFWRRGYHATSLADLEHRTGINRSTIYNSFDGKEGLFGAAVASYVSEMEAVLIEPLRQGTSGLTDLLAFIERHRSPLTDAAVPPGCLLANSIVTGEVPEAIGQYLRGFREAIDAALGRAVDLGEIGREDQVSYAATFLGCTLGANLAAKSGMSGSELDELLDGLRDTVKGWLTGPARATRTR